MPPLRNVVDINRRTGTPADRLHMPAGHSAHRAILETMLNELLALQLVCVLQYRRYSFVTKHLLVAGVKRGFLRYAQVQQEQADRIAERIVQLGGAPHVDPSDLATRSQARYSPQMDLQDMVGEDLRFVRTAIETFDDMVRYFEVHDLATARILMGVRAMHEEHAQELAELLTGLTPPLRR